MDSKLTVKLSKKKKKKGNMKLSFQHFTARNHILTYILYHKLNSNVSIRHSSLWCV